MSDRTVHAVRHDGVEIVRYDKAGKWWAEPKSDHPRFPIPTVRDAAELAFENLQSWHVGRPGGRVFDALISDMQETT
jgi:hypothetical protein